MAVNQGHDKLLGKVDEMVTSKLLDQMTLTPIGFIGSRGSPYAAHPHQQTHIPSVHNNNTLCHNNAPMIHASFFFPCTQFFMFHICMSFSSSPWLIWLTDPALVTSVYPTRMQYAPCVLQEASLLDGVDAGVRGNSRRFSKTSSYPPCCCYAFNLFYPYFLMMSSSPLFLLIHSFLTTHFTLLYLTNLSHTLYCPCSPYHFLHLARFGNIFHLWQTNVVKDLSWPLSYLV